MPLARMPACFLLASIGQLGDARLCRLAGFELYERFRHVERKMRA